MKYSLLLIFALFFHGEDLASFTFTNNDNSVKIAANLNASDLQNALDLDAKRITKKVLQNYLDQNFSIEINNDETPFYISDFELNHHHIVLNLATTKTHSTINEISVTNTLLFDVNKKQSNIIEIRFDGKRSDFLIDQQTPTLNISL